MCTRQECVMSNTGDSRVNSFRFLCATWDYNDIHNEGNGNKRLTNHPGSFKKEMEQALQ